MFSHSGHVMTLANSIIGVGILAMPFCFQKCGILLSVILIILSNWITRICCHYLIKSSLLTRRKSFEFLGFHAFGSSGKLLVELCIIGYLLGTCITYFVVVGDLGPQIIQEMFTLEGGHVHLRTIIMVAVTLICILPLGMLKNVDSLSMVCTASIGFYVCLVMKIVLESEEHIRANDWTEKVVYWRPAGILQCLPIFSMALSCQMQLFEVFMSVSNQSLEKLNGIVRNATWICTLVYIAVGFFGYVAFCTQAFSGNILMNFSSSFSSDIIKIGFILSVAFSFPLVIFPCRASIYSLLYRKGHADMTGYIPEARFKTITVFIVVFSLCIALMIPSVELIIGLVGSTIGVAICIMFPAACFRKIVKKDSTERSLGQLIFVGGFCLMILGTYANLSAIDEKRSGAHLETVEDHLLSQPATVKPAILITQDTVKRLEKELEVAKIEIVAVPQDRLDVRNDNDVVLKRPKNTPVVGESVQTSPPPLPVDETHKNAQPSLPVAADHANRMPPLPAEEKPLPAPKPSADGVNAKSEADKVQVLSPMPEVASKLGNETKTKAEKEIQPAIVAAENKQDARSAGTQQQTIDLEAIKKDEEIAAEEQKVKEPKTNDDQLKETQQELKKTKELLQRTVDELKEELQKQNKETQNLVVEKLEEVAEKVDQIERKVQQKELQQQPQSQYAAKDTPKAEPAPVKPAEQPERVSKQPGTLLNILADNSSADIYEPLSYKTGELIEYARNGSKHDQRLPLPLALLINAAQAKINSSLAASLNATAAVAKEQLQTAQLAGTKDKQSLAADTASKLESEKQKEHDIQKENVEAIRRDILQVNEQQLAEADIKLQPSGDSAYGQREKRSVDAEEIANRQGMQFELERENCLTEPKMETFLAHGLSNAIDLKMHGVVGRELMAVEEPAKQPR